MVGGGTADKSGIDGGKVAKGHREEKEQESGEEDKGRLVLRCMAGAKGGLSQEGWGESDFFRENKVGRGQKRGSAG